MKHVELDPDPTPEPKDESLSSFKGAYLYPKDEKIRTPRYAVEDFDDHTYTKFAVISDSMNKKTGNKILVVNRTEDINGWKKAYWFAVKIAEDLNAAEPGNPP